MFIFVIDTEQYAGNFERELCAYLTGQIGDCQVGDDMAEKFKEEEGEKLVEKFDDLIQRVSDEGCYRPVMIWYTEGWFNNGIGGHFRTGEEAAAQEDYVQKCIERADKKNVHPNDEGRNRKRWMEKSKEQFNKCPAYLSVGIFFKKRPPDDVVRLMRDRAKKFDYTLRGEKTITITGFRLVEEKKVQELLQSWPNE